jgi:hypothetical protein
LDFNDVIKKKPKSKNTIKEEEDELRSFLERKGLNAFDHKIDPKL